MLEITKTEKGYYTLSVNGLHLLVGSKSFWQAFKITFGYRKVLKGWTGGKAQVSFAPSSSVDFLANTLLFKSEDGSLQIGGVQWGEVVFVPVREDLREYSCPHCAGRGCGTCMTGVLEELVYSIR